MSILDFRCRLTRPSGFRLSAEFECGDGVTALFGPSGSGKSTILSLIAGLIRPDEGFIRLKDRTLTDTAARCQLAPERRRVGLVFQDGCLFPHLTVRENLEYGWRRQRTRRGELQHLIDVLEIGELLPRSPRTLSGGQKQRVALGRALMQRPDLLLLDEPLAGMDEPLQDRVLAYLKPALLEQSVPTVIVTHAAEHVARLAQAVLHVRNGTVFEDEQPVRR